MLSNHVALDCYDLRVSGWLLKFPTNTRRIVGWATHEQNRIDHLKVSEKLSKCILVSNGFFVWIILAYDKLC